MKPEILLVEPMMPAIEQALDLFAGSLPAEHAIRMLGLGWTAEEALGIALFCALKAKSFTRGLILAVNHDGDSDSTGAVCGNLLGAAGLYELPAGWESKLELAEYIGLRARELYEMRKRPPMRA